ncbi:MAG: DUF342 domain-containing protein [Bacillota bacterium]
MGKEKVVDQRAKSSVGILHGNVEVNYTEGGPDPTISSCPGVILIVNGVLCQGTATLTDDDQVQLDAQNETQKGAWEIRISEDELLAELIIKPEYIIERRVPDHPHQAYLQIRVEESTRAVSPLTLEQALQEMRKQGISFGIERDALEEAVSSGQEQVVIIARGNPPVKATEPWVDLKFRQEQRIPLEPGENEKIDYHERYSFTSVEVGALIAILRPGVAGQPGTSVKGRSLNPEPPKEMHLTAGKGVGLSENKQEAFTTMAGRPAVSFQGQNAIIQILPSLDIAGDVNLKTGNVRFKGDLLITGSVREGMVAEAWGKLQVNGDVVQASITGMGNVFIRENVLSSTVIAGGGSIVFKHLLPILEDIEDQLGGLDLALEQVSKKPGFDMQTKLGPLVQLLLDNKFKHLPVKAIALSNLLTNDKVAAEDARLKELSLSISRTLGRTPPRIDLNSLKSLHQLAKTLVEEYLAPFQQPGDLEIRYAQNSVLQATGNVVVRGQGCFNTKITAGGDISISKMFRGGEIFAVGNIFVGESGSQGGSLTKIRIFNNAKVTIGKAWENTTVQVGQFQYNFNQMKENTVVCLDDQGNLQVRRADSK